MEQRHHSSEETLKKKADERLDIRCTPRQVTKLQPSELSPEGHLVSCAKTWDHGGHISTHYVLVV